nr:hypothetical protein [Tanacetum cinerariifolium]
IDFLNAHTIQYALVVNPNIYVSCIKQFWATATIKKVNDAVQLRALIDRKKVVVTEDVIRRDLRLDDVDGVECLPNEEIFVELACMGYEKPPPKLTFSKAFFSAPWKFLIHTLVENLTSLSISLTAWLETWTALAKEEEEEEVEIPTAPAQPSPTSSHLPPLQDPIPTPLATPPQVQPFTPPTSPPQEQPTTTSKSSMSLLTTLMETCATLSKKVTDLEQDKHTQALEILKLKKRVKKLEKKKQSRSFGFKRLRKVGRDDRRYRDDDITLVDVETQEEVAAMDAKLQGRIDQDDEPNAASKGVNAAESTVFDVKEVTMTMAQTLIKMKAEKAKLLDEQISQRLHDKEIEKATPSEKQEKDDLERAKVLQK